ncbi:hypothetical protein ACFLQI_01740 [Candidatus Undinarchaeota archaeon]
MRMTEVSCPDCENKFRLDEELTEGSIDTECPECASDLRISKTVTGIKVQSLEEAEMLGVVKKENGYSDSAYGQYD